MGKQCEDEDDKTSETPRSKNIRPMPASIRRKLEAAAASKNVDHSPKETPSKSLEGGSSAGKACRPMPASARRKLEESSTNSNVVSTPPGSEVNSASTKKSTPMPASARRKLEESSNVFRTPPSSEVNLAVLTKKSTPMPASARRKLEEGSNAGSPSGSEVDADSSSAKRKTPMPASARRKLEDSSNANSPVTPSAPGSDRKKPMPASARKKLEEEGGREGEENVKSWKDSGSESEKVTETPSSSPATDHKVGRPMPASAKRKLEAKNDEKKSEDDKADHKTETNLNVSASAKSKPMPASARKKLEEAANKEEKSTPALQTAKSTADGKTDKTKINISLGGITFPKFSKPMPASKRKEMEEQKMNESTIKEPAESVMTDSPKKSETEKTRSSRRSKGLTSSTDVNLSASFSTAAEDKPSSRELTKLEDQKFYCQYCDYWAHQLSKKNKHEQIHFKEKTVPTEEKPPPAPKESSKKSSKPNYNGQCPHCLLRISNRKKLQKHVYRCGMPFRFACPHCEKKFKYEKDFTTHVATHSNHCKKSKDKESNHSSGRASDVGDESVKLAPSKTKAMPKSVREKLEKQKSLEVDEEEISKTKESPAETSYKSKIAKVLCGTLTRAAASGKEDSEVESDSSLVEQKSHNQKNKTSNGKNKKKKEKEESQSRPMPASHKKHVNEQSNKKEEKPKETVIEPDPPSDVDDDECQVCHRVFSSSRKRQKHELTVHYIQNPRKGPNDEENSSIAQEPSTVSANVSAVNNPEPDEHSTSGNEVRKDDTNDRKDNKFNFNSLPHAGECPFCGKPMTRLKRHVVNVHFGKDKVAAMMCSEIPSSSEPTATPKPPSSEPRAASSSIPFKDKDTIKPLKVLCPKYKRTFKMHKTNKSRAEDKEDSNPTTAKNDEEGEEKSPAVEGGDNDDAMDDDYEALTSSMTVQEETATESVKKNSLTPSNANIECQYCYMTFVVEADYTEHLKSFHPPIADVISCKICQSLFTQESDFLLHLKYKHDISANNNIHDDEIDNCKVTQSVEHSINVVENNDNEDGGSAMEVEEEESSGIAITSTFSQKNKNQKQDKKVVCSTCNETFDDQEALLRHDLYFHQQTRTKDEKMCQICGVYPTRLQRHMIAHENKTVRCSCAPCRLNFNEFSQLLEHNLRKHPGPNGGALSAMNRSREVNQTSSSSAPGESKDTTNESVITTSTSKPSNKRPMPASVRAKLESSGGGEQTSLATPASKPSSEKPTPSLKSRPMPASVRAKMEIEKSSSSDKDLSIAGQSTANTETKKSRAMPASVRAKLLANQESSSQVSSTSNNANEGKTTDSKPGGPSGIIRAMPASVRAKLEAAKEKINERNKVEQAVGSSKEASVSINQKDPEVIDLDDDDDDDDIIIEQDLSFPQPQIISTHDISIAPVDKLIDIEPEKHPHPFMESDESASFRCRMCDKILDSRDAARRHIFRAHSEYGPEHTENMIAVVYEDSKSRKKKRNSISDDETHDEPEKAEYIPRGTSRRPRGQTAPELESSRNSDVQLEKWACKLCGKRGETPGNIKRHVGRSHPEIAVSRREDVIMSLADENDEESVFQNENKDMSVESTNMPPTGSKPKYRPGPASKKAKLMM